MIHALGYHQTKFDSSKPGRLCRRRERWIDPWPLDAKAPMHRLLISGATFSDDSAHDALRGLGHSGIQVAQCIQALFPNTPMLAFTEDGHPADVPLGAQGVEMYVGNRSGGRFQDPLMRWHLRVQGLEALTQLLDANPQRHGVRGLALLSGVVDPNQLLDPLFLLTGLSSLDSPPAYYQPAALPEVLALCPAVVLFHRDKNGLALGIYSREPTEAVAPLAALCEASSVVLVDFAIPPMLARWDRALYDMRTQWLATRNDEFPVPPAADPSMSWGSRRSSRTRRRGSGVVMPSGAVGEDGGGEE